MMVPYASNAERTMTKMSRSSAWQTTFFGQHSIELILILVMEKRHKIGLSHFSRKSTRLNLCFEKHSERYSESDILETNIRQKRNDPVRVFFNSSRARMVVFAQEKEGSK